MTQHLPASSDDARSAAPLRHVRTVRFDGPINLHRGGVLPAAEIAYETWGRLDARRSNAVLVCHALSGDSHVARHADDPDDDPGWWDLLIGPGRPIDTDRYFVICSNVLGGCRGSTGPASINPLADPPRPYGPDFPEITVEDMVDLQARLIDHLGIDRLFAVVGGSLGGHQALSWATRHPGRVVAAVAVATSHRLTSQAMAFNVVGRNAILRDPHFHHGHYYDKHTSPRTGLALARMLGHITYLSRRSMADKFDHNRLEPRDITTEFEKAFSVGTYLAHQGDKFTERFDANSYLVLSKALDLFDLGADESELRGHLARSRCRWLVLSFTSDWLYPAYQSRDLVDCLIAEGRSVSYCNVRSDAGHDAFLLEENLASYGEMIRAFLDTTYLEPSFTPPPAAAAVGGSPLHSDRIDHSHLLDLIEPRSSVLDLGCGGGELLALLAHQRDATRLLGVELDEGLILQALRRGFDVVQSDLERGLPDLADKSFDYAVLSQTLQSIVRTEAIVEEVLRVGRRAIVSFPNFAYRKIRDDLYHRGRSPGSETGLLRHQWYNTPNRRFLSIDDWQTFCDTRGIRIERAVYLDTETGRAVAPEDTPNLHADLALFLISR